MALLDRIWVIHTTSRADKSDTNDNFSLHLPATGKAADSLGFLLRFPNLPHNERERGRTDQYEFDVRRFGIDHQEARGKISMSTDGGNAWLPQSIWVIGRTIDGEDHVLVARSSWPTNRKFSTNSSEGRRSQLGRCGF